MATEHRPPCPHCHKRVGYEEAVHDHHRCPHCGGDITWSVPFGSMGATGFRKSKAGPSWRKREVSA